MMRHMAEEKDGFPTYKALGYTDEDIAHQKQKVKTRVDTVNEYVRQRGKPLLFTNPQDTYQTAWEYYELMRFHYKEDFAQKYADLIISEEGQEIEETVTNCVNEISIL